MDRRTFIKESAKVVAVASSVLSLSARAYGRILGANDRIRLAQLGCGDRSRGHVHMAQLASKNTPVEHVAICDLWSKARERRAAQIKQAFGSEPKAYQYCEEMLASNDIDGVMIATGDFQHAKLCAQVVRAGKDCYCEKPFANVLADAKECRAAVKASQQVVQIGSQHRTQPYQLAVRDLVRSNRIGAILKIEQEWNVNMPRWHQRQKAIQELRPEDTDWKRWLLGKPDRPFDPRVYLEFRLFKDFSGGIFDQWLSHGSDLVHLWTDSTHPLSCVSSGGIYAWQDGRENPDTATALFTYPKGFLYSYSTTFGNSYRSFSRLFGREGTLENYGGEGASLFMATKEGGPHQPDPVGGKPEYFAPPALSADSDRPEIVRVPSAPPGDSHGPEDDDSHHLEDWLQAMRDRKQPSATIDHGFSHAICCMMAAQSYWSGKKLYWDAKNEEIVETPVDV